MVRGYNQAPASLGIYIWLYIYIYIYGLSGGKTSEKMAVPSAMTPEPAASPSVVEEAPSNRRGRVHGRVQKIFNFPEYLADRLRDEARLRSHEKGSRVTEKDIVVEALEALLKDR